ncbi:hypothetical protein HQ560_12515 [bacterium]|nr:hypothetical protein [bacterium]
MTRSSALLLACLVGPWASLGHAGAAVKLDVVLVSASGRGGKATYDSRIPANVREKIKKSALAYSRYDLAGRQSRTARYGAESTFRMTNGESLAIKPAANASRTHPVRLDIRVLNAGGKSLMKTQLRVRYGSPFLLHRPPLLIAITALKAN